MTTVSFLNLINLSLFFGPAATETNAPESRGLTKAPLAQATTGRAENVVDANNANNAVGARGQGNNAVVDANNANNAVGARGQGNNANNANNAQANNTNNTNDGQVDVHAQVVVRAQREEIQTLLGLRNDALRAENQYLQQNNYDLKELEAESKLLAVQAGVKFQEIVDDVQQVEKRLQKAEKRLSYIQNAIAASILAVIMFFCMIYVFTTVQHHMPVSNFSNKTAGMNNTGTENVSNVTGYFDVPFDNANHMPVGNVSNKTAGMNNTVTENVSNATGYFDVPFDNVTRRGLDESILNESATLPNVTSTINENATFPVNKTSAKKDNAFFDTWTGEVVAALTKMCTLGLVGLILAAVPE